MANHSINRLPSKQQFTIVKLSWLLVLVLIVYSCGQTPTSLNVDELSKYVIDPDNGLIKEKKANAMDLSLYYKPTGLLIAQESTDILDKDQLERLQQKYDPYAYFILDISANERNALYGSGDLESFSENLQTLAFRMNQYANLTTSSNDTIPVADFIYPRTFGMSKSATVMLVFNNDKIAGTDWVSFNLIEFGMNTGDQQFRFNTADLLSVPSLKM